MKRLIPLVLVALALAAVPAALADNGGSTPTAPTPSGQAQTGPAAQAGGPLAELRIRLRLVEQRFARNCGANAAATRLERCATVAQNVEQRLQTLDGKVQQRIQANCSTSSSAKGCAMLTQLDTRLQALIQKVQAWLGGQSSSGSSSTTTTTADPGDASLDHAASSLGQLTP